MNRCFCILLALLPFCSALAAPAPEPFLRGWGQPVDPDKDCKIRRQKGALTIEMPGTAHEYSLHHKRLNAPRLLREFEGDFEMQVRVRIDCRPSAQSSVKDQPSYVSAGFLVVLPDKSEFALERLEYRVAGQGDEADGCAATLDPSNERGENYSAFSKKNHPLWPFKSKPEHVYLRLERWGYLLSLSISPDGKSWVPAGGSAPILLPSKIKVGFAACTTSSDPSKVVFDQLTITKGKKREPWEFASGWGNPIDPDRDCKIQRDKDSLTVEMPGTDHDYDPVRKRFNAPRLLCDLEGRFDLQVRVRIDYRPSSQSTVKDKPSFVSGGFLLIYPDKNYSICSRLEYAVAKPGSRLAAPRVESRLPEQPRQVPAPKEKETASYVVKKIWIGADQREGNGTEWDHERPRKRDNVMWERGWPNWPLSEKADCAYLRLDHREGWSCFYISPDGEKWTRLDYLHSVPAGGKVGLAAYSTSSEPSKVIFDRLKLARGKKAER